MHVNYARNPAQVRADEGSLGELAPPSSQGGALDERPTRTDQPLAGQKKSLATLALQM
jgi:hypothetical protein